MSHTKLYEKQVNVQCLIWNHGVVMG